MARATALVSLLMEAGISAEGARLVSRAVDALGREGCGSDDVAGGLLRWRCRGVRTAYARGCFETELSLLGPSYHTPDFVAPESGALDLDGTGGPSADPGE